MPETIHVEGLTNAEFFERYAAPGRIGLFGGPELINRMIGRAQRHLDDTRAWSRWSHAFLFQGRRPDGHHWVVESDLDIHRKHIRLGVQENRVTKYHDDAHTTALAVLDFGLTPTQVDRVLAGALELVAQRTRYSLREITGTAWAMRHPEWRPRENLLARDRAFSARRLCATCSRRRAWTLCPASPRKTRRPNTSPAPPCRTRSG